MIGPYELNSIHQGDCLDLMPAIPDRSIDMILADLPYGTTACHWDSPIPLEPLWAQYKRIIKPNGAIVLTGSQPFTSVLVMSNLEWFRVEWIWDKKMVANFGGVKYQPLRQHENVLVFCKSSPNYNPQYRNNALSPFGKLRGETQTPTGTYGADFQNGVGYPKTIISDYPRPNNLTDGGLHPTQKPVALFAYLIRTYSNPGDLILDNVCGSGTTAIAAIETGRNWLCFEKDAEYYRIAKERIETRLLQPFLLEIETEKVEPVQMELNQ